MKLIQISILLICLTLSGCAKFITNRTIASTPQLNSSCSDIVSNFLNTEQFKVKLQSLKQDLLLVNIEDYKEKEKVQEIFKRLKTITLEIKDTDEIFNLLKFLKEIAATKRVDNSTTHLFASQVQYLLSSIDLKKKILSLSENLSDNDKFSILENLKEIERIIIFIGIENKRNINSMKIQGHIKDIELIFSPESYKYFIDEIIDLTTPKNTNSLHQILAKNYNTFLEYDEVYINKDIFSPETAKIIHTLPTEIQNKAKRYAIKRYEEFSKKGNKELRRNMEFLIRVFSQNEFNEVKSSINLDNYIEKINLLFKSVNPSVQYNFEEVLNVSKIIQENLAVPMLKENESIYIYGSLPNGKANFKTSDIDIHFHGEGFQRNKDSLSKWQILATDPELKEFRNEFEMKNITNRGTSNTQFLASTEEKVAKIIGRKNFKQGELLGSIADDSDFFKLNKLGVYNSILIEVFNNKLRVHIIDVFSSSNQHLTIEVD